jgi:hypothetical protein
MKVYTSKLGLRFSISQLNRPKQGDVVFFTIAEWDWMKTQNLKPEEFKALWHLKSENHHYCPIPEQEQIKQCEDTAKIAAEVIKSIWPNGLQNK